MQERLDSFLEIHDFKIVKKISKGYASEVFLVKNRRGKLFALKLERDKSPRRGMVEKESRNLLLANTVGVGPRLELFDLKNRVVVMEFIDGVTFRNWLFEKKPSKKILAKFVEALLVQAKKLDEANLDHGQLAGSGKNILVRKNKPVIIDFEKGAIGRRVHNANQVESLLFRNPNSVVTKKVKSILGL